MTIQERIGKKDKDSGCRGGVSPNLGRGTVKEA